MRVWWIVRPSSRAVGEVGVTGECSDEGEDVIAKVESEGLFIFVWETWNRK